MTDISYPDRVQSETEREAYRMGWTDARPVPTQLLLEEYDTVTEAVEETSKDYHHYTESAHYCNIILPRLRELAGYEDAGHGTYSSRPGPAEGMALDTLVDLFRRGYLDRTEAELAQQARHPRHRTD
jgi:hypothetical protein